MKMQRLTRLIIGFIFMSLCSFYVIADAADSQKSNETQGDDTKNDNTKSDNTKSDNTKSDNTKKSTKAEKMSSQKKELEHFTAVSLSGIGDLYIKQSTEENFTVEAPDKVLPLINVYVKEGTLYIDVKDSSKVSEAKINYYLNVKNIQKVTSYSSSNVYIKEGLEGKSLDLAIGNLGEAVVQLNLDKVNARIDSGGKITLRGIVKEQNYTINGAGEINASRLFGKIGNISITGSGTVITEVTDKLTANINGDGIVQYCGNPDITRNISGKGKVTSLSEKECNR